jgi:hypothetical protein
VSKKIAIFPRYRRGRNEIKSDFAIVFDPDVKHLKPLGAAMMKVIKREINAIYTPPAAATVRRRGPGRLFNVTGRLKKGMRLRRRGDTWEIEAPANRLTVNKVRERLGEVAPNLINPDRMMTLAKREMSAERFMKPILYKKRGWIGRALGWIRGR